MTYQGHVENGTVVLDTPGALPEGARVEIAVQEEPAPSQDAHAFLNWVLELANSIPEEDLEKAPKDGAINHDHYLYGTRKCEP